jgi:sulfate transport system ATP-binding protein
MTIDVVGISKRFGGFLALDQINLTIGQGELLALLGPSGSGKTTLLRIIAGLETPDEGSILFAGEDAVSRHPRDRGVGFVFQHYALFRHMTVFNNVAFGLTVRRKDQRPPASEIRQRVERLLELVQLAPLGNRYPNQLSGGQRQRVALARALAIEPQVLLLDEPFGALDAKVRKELRRWLRQLHDTVHVTSIFVTHDQEEALELADRVVVMGQGRIEQVGTPADVYTHPASPFVYDFLGDVNRLAATVEEGLVRLQGGDGTVIGRLEGVSGAVTLYVRHHDLELVMPETPGAIPATLRLFRTIGPVARAELVCAGQEVEILLPLDRIERMPGSWLAGGAPVALGVRRALGFPCSDLAKASVPRAGIPLTTVFPLGPGRRAWGF